MKKNLVWFEEVGRDDVSLVGGKGANLGEMITAGFPVPYGFILTSGAYFNFIAENDLLPKIKNILKGCDVENAKELENAAVGVRKIILQAKISKSLAKDVSQAYENLTARGEKMFKKTDLAHDLGKKMQSTFRPPLVAVRSSATAEDLPDASFAGQQETYLNVLGENNLLQKIKECYASLFTERAIYYRQTKGFDHFKVGLSAVVQLMVQSEKSGIAFSIDPVSGNSKQIFIEAIFGLGEYVVQGRVSPDTYILDKASLTILKKEIRIQPVKLIKSGTDNKEVRLAKKTGSKTKLTDREIVELAGLVKKIEKHYFFPQDIEWAIAEGRIFIVQSRPVTTTGTKQSAPIKSVSNVNSPDFVKASTGEQLSNVTSGSLLIKCDPASPGISFGKPVVLASPAENDKIKKGDILVAQYTSPDYVPAMKRAAAIVTEMGGRTSHAAIVSRELGIPAVVGADRATKLLKNESIITVNGSTGEVFRGNLMSSFQPLVVSNQFKSDSKKLKTVTRLYVNLAQPEAAERVARLNVDGIGLLRAEFIMADIGIHPKLVIRQGRQNEFIDKLVKSLLKFVKPFSPRPIVYRATDFRTNEYRHLKGGEEYEPREENPMIGFRGASRYLADKAVFAMELAAIKKIRKMGYKNINLMIPFVRTPQEMIDIKKILKEYDLDGVPSFKLWIMVEVPSSAILIEDFIKVGIDGVSIGTNDLTMLLLGVDRDNQEISNIYDERNPVVLWALERVIKTCKKYKITSSICGQAPSDYPELTEKLVKWGISSVSVTPDVIDRTRQIIWQAEEKLWQKSKK